MERKCQKCGYQLAENDFLCPKCGAIYGEPVYVTPKAAQPPAPSQQKQHKLPPAIFAGIALLIVLASLLLWNPFQPAATMPSTSHTQPTTSALPTSPPTTLPPTIPTTVPTTAPPPATMPPTVPATTLADNQRQLNWTMDAKVVDTSGKLISDGTVTINGIITDNPESTDTLYLDIVFPFGFRYLIGGYQEYIDVGSGLFGPYYICIAYAYDRIENYPEFITFALDPEAECALFILPNDPEQYLVCSTAADVNAEEVIAHFQAFLDSRNPN